MIPRPSHSPLALLAAALLAHTASAQDLSTSGWRMWPDTNATWVSDSLFLPEQVVLNNLPTNAPTGGWNVLNPSTGISVSLPATVEQYFWAQLPGTTDVNGYYKGVSWWWRSFTAPSLQAGQRLIIRFRGARMRSEVYCNQKLHAYNLITEIPFEADLTDAVQPGTNNLLAVRITNPGGSPDWRDIELDGLSLSWSTNAMPLSHAFGGLDAGIMLEVRDAVNVDNFAVLNRPDPHEIWMVGEVKSTGPAYNGPVDLSIQQGSNLVWTGSVNVSVPAGGTNFFTNAVTNATAQLWSLTNPVLYTASAVITGSSTSGRSADFGYRWFAPEGIGTNALLRLNGKRIVLRSAISWGFWAPNGLFPDDASAEKEVLAAQTLGLNCLHFHRNIGRQNVFDVQDRLGLLRYEEPGAGFNAWSDTWWDEPGIVPPTNTTGSGGGPNNFRRKYETAKILAMVKRDRSHPSLVVYGLQNETVHALTNPHIFWLLHQIRAIDPSRTVVLHSGIPGVPPYAGSVPTRNQALMLPYTTNFLYENGTGYSGWADIHTWGGPGAYRDNLYISTNNFSHIATNKTEVFTWGEMLGAAVPDDHEKIVNHYQTNNATGYDLTLHQKVLGTYNDFLDRWNFRSSFPTASSLFTGIGEKSYFFWGKIMEAARACDPIDNLVISGWESTSRENHSGIVDTHRNFRADPTLLSRALSPEVLMIRPKRFVLKPGDLANVDVHLVNETGRSGAQTLTLTAQNPDGSILYSNQSAVTVSGGDVFGQVLGANFLFTPNTNGTVVLTGVLQPNGGTGLPLTNTVELHVIDPLAGNPLLPRVAVVADDGQISQTLSNVLGVAPLGALNLNHPLDAVVMGGSVWKGSYYAIAATISNTPDPALFQTQMFGKTGTIGVWSDLAPGICTVQVYLAEQYWGSAGARLFDLAINDSTVMTNFDIHQQAGGKNSALIKSFAVNATNGVIKIAIPNVQLDNATLAGITITDATTNVVAVAFRQTSYTASDGRVWQPYAGTIGISDAQWNSLLARVANEGIRLVLWPNGLKEATNYINRLSASNIVQITSAASFTGSLPQARASWMGSWYFARKHWMFDNLPSESVLGWQYQIPQFGSNVNALLLAAKPGKPMEVMVGYGRDHEAAVGIGACVIHHGRGIIVLPSLPDLRDALTTTGRDITQPAALRLFGNALRPQPVDLPGPWQHIEIGNVGASGWTYYMDNAFGLAAAGTDIWGQADGFGFIYQPFTGDGVISARVANEQAVDIWTKAGVMFRESLTAGSRHAIMSVAPQNLASFQWRLVMNGTSDFDAVSIPTNTPYWVRLARSGDKVTGYVSSNAVNWVQVGPALTFSNLPTTIYCGLAVTSNNTNQPALVSFDQVTINHTPSLLPPGDHVLTAGNWLFVTNEAADADAPPQALTFSLLGAPPSAAINSNNGVISWRPAIAHGGNTYPFISSVADDGWPSLGATQIFQVTVNTAMPPTMGIAPLTAGQFQVELNGDSGPDYHVQSATNLISPANWITVFATNAPLLPFTCMITNNPDAQSIFYRALLGP